MPPKIDRTNLITVRIKAGQNFAFDVNISGEPAPDKKWKLKNKEIKTGGPTLIKYHDYNTKLKVNGATRNENGMYTITAENCNGKDSADVEVIVLGKYFFNFQDSTFIYKKLYIVESCRPVIE